MPVTGNHGPPDIRAEADGAVAHRREGADVDRGGSRERLYIGGLQYTSLAFSAEGLRVCHYRDELGSDGVRVVGHYMAREEVWGWDEIAGFSWGTWGATLPQFRMALVPGLRDDAVFPQGRGVVLCSSRNFTREGWRQVARAVEYFTEGRIAVVPRVPRKSGHWWKTSEI
ncbi:hypothetical protein [Streptomyces sp. NPDC015350]|uniref:hypothetical protein n=1 Tax=Streptomyces sp. NPDC015350 TaxID=3364955 RepID=UPI0036F6D105